MTELKQIQGRKRGAAGASSRPAAARPMGAVAKKPRPSVAAPPPPRRDEAEEEDEVVIVQGPPMAIPIPRSPPSPASAPEPESTQAAVERKRKGKESASSSAPEKDEEEMHTVSYSVPVSASAIGSRALALEILRMIALPADVESRKSRSQLEIARSLYVGLFKVGSRTEKLSLFYFMIESSDLTTCVIFQFIMDISILEDGAAGFAEFAKTARSQVEQSKADADAAKELQKAGEL